MPVAVSMGTAIVAAVLTIVVPRLVPKIVSTRSHPRFAPHQRRTDPACASADLADAWGCSRTPPQLRMVRQIAPNGAMRVLATILTEFSGTILSV